MFTGWDLAFCIVWLLRHVRVVCNSIAHWTYKSTPIPGKPSYSSQDVTIILPTIAQGGDELITTLETCLRTEPRELILVTTDSNYKTLKSLAKRINSQRIRVLSVRVANKRLQMCRAIPEVSTPITIFVDDDVIWGPKIMPWILAPFEDSKVGGVGTSQSLKRPEKWSGWAFLGAAYLQRRNYDCSACLRIDGGLPCLSGRTAAYRSRILQDEAFTHGFMNEQWRTYQLNAADDDNFLTRWLYSHDWKIKMQYHPEAEVQTTLEDGPKYLSQCLRWSRSNWRSNLTSMFIERHCWRTQPWSTYAVYQTTLTAWGVVWDPLQFFLLHMASRSWTDSQRTYAFVALILWIYAFSKTVKLWGLFARHPVLILYMPLYIAFGYLHSFIKLYAWITINTTTWGSRDGADTDNDQRMVPLPPYDWMTFDGPKSETYDYPEEMQLIDQLPAYDTHRRPSPLPATTSTTPYHD